MLLQEETLHRAHPRLKKLRFPNDNIDRGDIDHVLSSEGCRAYNKALETGPCRKLPSLHMSMGITGCDVSSLAD